MAHRDKLDTSFIKNPDVAHEESDVNIRPIAWFMVWLTVATAVVMLLMIGLYRFLDNQATRQDERQRSPLAGERNPIPPGPVLQMAPNAAGQIKPPEGNNTPTAEIDQVRHEERLKLEHYTWVDESKGIVSLPIDRAADLALERGLLKSRPPATTSTPAARPASETPEPGRLQQGQSDRKQGDEKH